MDTQSPVLTLLRFPKPSKAVSEATPEADMDDRTHSAISVTHVLGGDCTELGLNRYCVG